MDADEAPGGQLDGLEVAGHGRAAQCGSLAQRQFGFLLPDFHRRPAVAVHPQHDQPAVAIGQRHQRLGQRQQRSIGQVDGAGAELWGSHARGYSQAHIAAPVNRGAEEQGRSRSLLLPCSRSPPQSKTLLIISLMPRYAPLPATPTAGGRARRGRPWPRRRCRPRYGRRPAAVWPAR